MNRIFTIASIAALAILLLAVSVQAGTAPVPLYQATPSTPSIISYQGRVLVNGARFNGAGLFKFSIINGAGDTAYWSNDGTGLGAAPFQPSGNITLTVNNGIFGVAFGDTSIAGMTQPITAGIATSPDRSLRVWFNDGALGWQQLAPDVALASVPYALVADSAASATTATTATFASSASTAVSATTASTATSSHNADLLGGLAASSSPTGSAIVSTDVSGTVALSKIYGGTAANDDLTLGGTSHATKTSSYVILQPIGGSVGIGTYSPDSLLTLSTTWASGLAVVGNQGIVFKSSSYTHGIYPSINGRDLDFVGQYVTRFSSDLSVAAGKTLQIASTPDQYLGRLYHDNLYFNIVTTHPGSLKNAKPIKFRIQETGGDNYIEPVVIDSIGRVSIGTIYPVSGFTLTVAGDIGPTTTTVNLGSSSLWWNEIHYKTLVSHSLGTFESGVKLRDSRIVSCLDALAQLAPDKEKLLKSGQPHMDYSTLPEAAYRPAINDTIVRMITTTNWIANSTPITDENGILTYFYTITETLKGEPGADLDAMVSLVLCASNEVNAKSATLEARIAALEKLAGVKTP